MKWEVELEFRDGNYYIPETSIEIPRLVVSVLRKLANTVKVENNIVTFEGFISPTIKYKNGRFLGENGEHYTKIQAFLLNYLELATVLIPPSLTKQYTRFVKKVKPASRVKHVVEDLIFNELDFVQDHLDDYLSLVANYLEDEDDASIYLDDLEGDTP